MARANRELGNAENGSRAVNGRVDFKKGVDINRSGFDQFGAALVVPLFFLLKTNLVSVDAHAQSIQKKH